MLLLHHTEVPPERGSDHYDWMILHGAALMTFRVRERIDACPSRFTGERLSDHRLEYLSFEGPLTGGRGRVRRVAVGHGEVIEAGAEKVRIRGAFDGIAGGDRLFCGTLVGEGRWVFTVTPADAAYGSGTEK